MLSGDNTQIHFQTAPLYSRTAPMLATIANPFGRTAASGSFPGLALRRGNEFTQYSLIGWTVDARSSTVIRVAADRPNQIGYCESRAMDRMIRIFQDHQD